MGTAQIQSARFYKGTVDNNGAVTEADFHIFPDKVKTSPLWNRSDCGRAGRFCVDYAVCLCGSAGEKTNRESPQTFPICNLENDSAEYGQSKAEAIQNLIVDLREALQLGGAVGQRTALIEISLWQ